MLGVRNPLRSHRASINYEVSARRFLRPAGVTASLRFLFLLLIATILVSGTLASADPFGTGTSETGLLADNHDHDWCWSTGFWSVTMRAKAYASHKYLESVTDFSGGSGQSCNSGTDVHWQALNTTAYRGIWSCMDVNGDECDNGEARITTNTDVLPVSERRKTICHELGHSTGASHHSSGFGCMVSGTSTAETYVTHTINHMDDLEVSTS